MNEQQAQISLWKNWTFWGMILSLPLAVVGVTQLYDWAMKSAGPQLSVTTDLDNIELPPETKIEKTIRSFAVVSIKNTGDRPAEDVTIRLKNFGDYLLRRENEKRDGHSFTNEILIGSLKIEESVECSIWTASRILPTYEPVIVTHSLGSVAAYFPTKEHRRTRIAGMFFDEELSVVARWLPAVLLLVVLFMTLMITSRRVATDRQRSPPESK
jgi:hypothetical protein